MTIYSVRKYVHEWNDLRQKYGTIYIDSIFGNLNLYVEVRKEETYHEITKTIERWINE